jgi:uncharacterized RDD family membrane protein YckC
LSETHSTYHIKLVLLSSRALHEPSVKDSLDLCPQYPILHLMKWYYVSGGQQAGPVEDAQLQELRQGGQIQGDTLVWHEGMAEWQPFGQVHSGGPAQSGATTLATDPPRSGQEAACAECGKIFPVDNMIQFGEARVCASCKPIFVQKLSEGAQVSATRLNYASVGTRFAAVFLDGIILWVLNVLIALATGSNLGQAVGIEPRTSIALTMILFCIQMATAIAYEVFFIGKFGATLGKMACKIRVVTADGGSVSYLRAAGRYFAKLISAFACLIGYIMAIFDDEKRALHDRICNTRVILK